MESTEEAGLVLCWETNGEELFNTLWRVVSHAVRDRMGVLLPMDIEDVTMEAITLAARRSDVRAFQDLRRLALGIARNIAVDRVRRHLSKKRGGGRTESLEEQDGNSLPATESEFGEQLDRGWITAELSLLQESLPPRMQLLIQEHYVNGLTHAQIAEKHGIPVGSIGTTLRRAVLRMRLGF